ncbi:polyhydroxyalkanoic acid system family protein [Pseudomarimonas salicorniae]|uniref:Polyhydroxyalkanoic acid system family protein n=1 Tax=Pseudomarimonas salicorniae TaxID=2933270 RepID=A0ABT0GKF8_9GAMM|nr:polyhydroxyalkanoic acid system family protein [Lysobacter sp. CAU 1642]MCK7594898.1 polyhydroxyalkanoic acid system family protein [Lysobacter sp. CAU 1642]
MPTVRVERQHSKPIKAAKASVERVAEHIAERFDVEYEWEGETLHFQRTGVDGHIHLEKHKVTVVANLGFLLGALKGPVERAIHEYIDKEFG